jgi:hypothetical protein
VSSFRVPNGLALAEEAKKEGVGADMGADIHIVMAVLLLPLLLLPPPMYPVATASLPIYSIELLQN